MTRLFVSPLLDAAAERALCVLDGPGSREAPATPMSAVVQQFAFAKTRAV